jgi:hypothetical protein
MNKFLILFFFTFSIFSCKKDKIEVVVPGDIVIPDPLDTIKGLIKELESGVFPTEDFNHESNTGVPGILFSSQNNRFEFIGDQNQLFTRNGLSSFRCDTCRLWKFRSRLFDKFGQFMAFGYTSENKLGGHISLKKVLAQSVRCNNLNLRVFSSQKFKSSVVSADKDSLQLFHVSKKGFGKSLNFPCDPFDTLFLKVENDDWQNPVNSIWYLGNSFYSDSLSANILGKETKPSSPAAFSLSFPSGFAPSNSLVFVHLPGKNLLISPEWSPLAKNFLVNTPFSFGETAYVVIISKKKGIYYFGNWNINIEDKKDHSFSPAVSSLTDILFFLNKY